MTQDEREFTIYEIQEQPLKFVGHEGGGRLTISSLNKCLLRQYRELKSGEHSSWFSNITAFGTAMHVMLPSLLKLNYPDLYDLDNLYELKFLENIQNQIVILEDGNEFPENTKYTGSADVITPRNQLIDSRNSFFGVKKVKEKIFEKWGQSNRYAGVWNKAVGEGLIGLPIHTVIAIQSDFQNKKIYRCDFPFDQQKFNRDYKLLKFFNSLLDNPCNVKEENAFFEEIQKKSNHRAFPGPFGCYKYNKCKHYKKCPYAIEKYEIEEQIDYLLELEGIKLVVPEQEKRQERQSALGANRKRFKRR